MHRLLPVLLLMTLSACSTAPNKSHHDLPEITDQEGCIVLDRIVADASWGTPRQQAPDAARSQAVRLALEAGANAIYFEKTYSELWGSSILASALHCDGEQLLRQASLTPSRVNNL